MWYESTDDSHNIIIMVDIKCPVCRAILGQREAGDRKWIHCAECRCDFYFAPNKDIPTRVRMDSAAKKGCTCGRC
jgi:hypothetical protein